MAGELSAIYPRLDGDNGCLLCPRCGELYLHHLGVTVFDRREDDEITTVTAVLNGMVSSHREPSNVCENPSSRRDGIAIEFFCEQCDGGSEHTASTIILEISQHKGTTMFSWREGRWSR